MKNEKKTFSRVRDIPRGHAGKDLTKGCLVLEGGGFRGVYVSGVLDAFMQHNINFECVIGVSAGALNGTNYVSGQIGRSGRANLGFRHDSRFIGLRAIGKSGGFLNMDFLLNEYNRYEDFDQKSFDESQQRFVIVATNCLTGETTYFEKGSGVDMLQAALASASMPFLTPMIMIDDVPYLDGGCSCKIAYEWALKEDYDKIIVVRTQNRDYRKHISSHRDILPNRVYRKYPEFAKALANSSVDYNRQCDELIELENKGRIFVIAPSQPIQISRLEKDMEKLGELYELGYQDGLNALESLKAYVERD